MLITGAGSGLGRDLAKYFAGRGFRLLVTDLSESAAQETLRQLPGAEQHAAWALDVADAAAVARRFQQDLQQPIHILVNNAGLQHVAPLEDFPPEKWSLLIDVMLKGPAYLSRAVLPQMRAQGFGRIVNIGSIHSLVASPFKSAYTAAKHGLIGLAKTLALETSDADITVNTICPAYIRTPLVDAQIASQSKVHGISEEEVIRRIMLEPMPKKAFITTEEVAGTIEFLLGSAARNITGQCLTLDGGWTAR
jgi:3-hydroxybutyrate dehydrogenase